MPRIVSNTLVKRSVNRSLSQTFTQTVNRSAAGAVSFVCILLLAGCGTAGNSIVAAPTFTPAAGKYNAAQTVTIGDTTPGAVLHCTTDGTAPSTSSPVCSEPMTVARTETLSALAVGPDGNQSSVASAAYTIDLTAAATPTFSPAAGTYESGQTVSLADATAGANIYYTLDGTTPSATSMLFAPGAPITIPGDLPAAVTINAVAIETGYAPSAVATGTFTIAPPAPAPTITPSNPAGVTNTGALSGVTIADSLAGAAIHYLFTPGGALDATDIATPASPIYQASSPFTVPQSGTLSAIATAPGYSPSSPTDQYFSLTAIAPVLTFASGGAVPATGTYNSVQTVSISDATQGATIYFTTDGSTPSAMHGNAYTSPIAVATTGETITAVATASGFSSSAPVTAQFSLVAPTPAITPVTGTYNTTETVSISDSNPNATIFYTTNGTTPTVSSTPYTQSFTAGQNFADGQSETVQAIAHLNGFTDSSPVSSVLTFDLPVTPTPSITPPGGTFASTSEPTVTISAPGAAIYYTVTQGTAGTAPTIGAAGTLSYTGSFQVTQSEVVEAIAVLPGDAPSQTATQAYTINQTSATPPMFSVAAGTYSAVQMVTISDGTPNSTIYYAVGSAPTLTPGNIYTSGTVIDVATTETLYAIATAPGFNPSTTATATYTISLSAGTLTFSQPSGTVLNASSPAIAISGAASGATIYYTTDGTTPSSSNGTTYDASTGILVTAPVTIKAIAIESGYTSSAVASATYEYQVDTPVISPGGGSFSTATDTITISDGTAGATIYYTVSTNGTTPTTSSQTIASGGTLTLSASDVVEAYAVDTSTGYTNSSVATATFTKSVSSGPSVTGTVVSGTQPVLGATVQLYAAGTSGYGSAPTAVGSSATTDATNGTFSLSYDCSTFAAPGDLIYAVATGGKIGSGAANAGIGLMTALGPCASLATTLPNGGVTVNEVTTIASVYALSGFASFASSGIDIGAPTGTPSSTTCAIGSIGNSTCNYSGLFNAFATVNNLVDIGTGAARTITPAYAANPVPYLNTSTVPQARIDTLADLLATCVEASSGCAALFSDAGGSTSPVDTIQAALDIALNPGSNVAALYGLLQSAAPYTPTLANPGGGLTGLTSAPGDWTLAITYTGGGLGVDYSKDPFDNVQGNYFALDSLGNLWVVAVAPNSVNGVHMEAQTGMIAGFNYLGAPLTPATTFDPVNNVVTSFGGYGPAGIAPSTFPGVSPIDEGASAIATDESNNLWVIAGTTLSRVAVDLTNPTAPLAIDTGADGQINIGNGGANSFAFDPSGNLWISSGGQSVANAPVYELNPANGAVITQFPTITQIGLLDLTFDSAGGLWGGDVVDQNTQLYNPSTGAQVATIGNTNGFYLAAGAAGNIYTCDGFSGYDVFSAASTTPVNYNVNGGCGPFAIDGAGNIWSPYSQVLTEVSQSGNLVTPAAGYSATSSAESPTVLQAGNDSATAIDGSGNLWVLNGPNYLSGGAVEGNALVEFVGVAAPTIPNLAVATRNGAQGTRP